MRGHAGGGDPAVLIVPSTPTEDFHGVTALPSGGFVTAAHDEAQVDTLIAVRNGQRTVVLQTKGPNPPAPSRTCSSTGSLAAVEVVSRQSSSHVPRFAYDAGEAHDG